MQEIIFEICCVVYKNPVTFPLGVDISDLLVYMFIGRSVGNLNYNYTECGTASTSATKSYKFIHNFTENI